MKTNAFCTLIVNSPKNQDPSMVTNIFGCNEKSEIFAQTLNVIDGKILSGKIDLKHWHQFQICSKILSTVQG